MQILDLGTFLYGKQHVHSCLFLFTTLFSILIVFLTCNFLSCWWFSVPFRHGERIGFSYLVSQKYTGDNATITVLRDSKMLKFNIKLATHRRIIPAHNKGKPPSYYIIAGFVFSTVSVPYLRSEVHISLWNTCLGVYICFWKIKPYLLLLATFCNPSYQKF